MRAGSGLKRFSSGRLVATFTDAGKRRAPLSRHSGPRAGIQGVRAQVRLRPNHPRHCFNLPPLLNAPHTRAILPSTRDRSRQSATTDGVLETLRRPVTFPLHAVSSVPESGLARRSKQPRPPRLPATKWHKMASKWHTFRRNPPFLRMTEEGGRGRGCPAVGVKPR